MTNPIVADTAKKHCAKCTQVKSRAEFGVDKRTHDGLSYECKECYRVRYNLWAVTAAGKASLSRSKVNGYFRRRYQRRKYYREHQDEIRAQKRTPEFRAKRNELSAKRRADPGYQRTQRKYKESTKCKQTNRRRTLQQRYRMTLEQYDQLLQLQNGHCAICSAVGSQKWPLVVDHDHLTGQVRGLLCGIHNRGLGALGDSVTFLRAAIKYLQSPPARRAFTVEQFDHLPLFRSESAQPSL